MIIEPIRVLNLYAGLGGNRKKWRNVKVTAVEIDSKIADVYREQNPDDEIFITDAHEFLLHNYKHYDWIWSSPPCQRNTKMIISGRNRKPVYPDLRLYEQAIFLNTHFKGFYTIENVVPYYGALMPAKKLGRHLFWSNFDIEDMAEVPEFKNMMSRQNISAKKQLQDWLDIHYEQNIYYANNHCVTQVLRNCVHPDIGLHIYNQLLKTIK